MPLNYTDFNATRDFMNYTEQGRFLDAIFGTYWELIGVWFFVLMFLFVMAMVYIKTQSLSMVCIIIIFLSFGMAQVLPTPMMQVMYAIVVLGIGGLITSIYTSGG